MTHSRVLYAGIFVCLTGLSNSVIAEKMLSADEVKKLTIGKTANGQHLKKGHKYKVFFDANGTYVQARTDGSVFRGKWRIKGNKHCIAPNHRKKEFCRSLRNTGKGTYVKVKERAFGSNIDVVKLSNFVDGNKTK